MVTQTVHSLTSHFIPHAKILKDHSRDHSLTFTLSLENHAYMLRPHATPHLNGQTRWEIRYWIRHNPHPPGKHWWHERDHTPHATQEQASPHATVRDNHVVTQMPQDHHNHHCNSMNNGLSYTPIHDHDWTDDHASHSSILINSHYTTLWSTFSRYAWIKFRNILSYTDHTGLENWSSAIQYANHLFKNIYFYIFLGSIRIHPYHRAWRRPAWPNPPDP